MAIAYFACANRNQSLFNALKKFVKEETNEQKQQRRERREEGYAEQKHEENQGTFETYMASVFKRIIMHYDFMSIVMYPELKKRREFVHDAWIVAKMSENRELKEAIIDDPYFQLNREDILQLLQTRDNHIINLVLQKEVMLHV